MTEVLRLSAAEFLVLHTLLGEPECPGVDLSSIQQSAGPPDEALEAGLGSLQERGLVARHGTTLRVHATLALTGQLLFFPTVSVLRWDETEVGQDGFAAVHLLSGVALRWTWSSTCWEGALVARASEAFAALCLPVPPRRRVAASLRLPREVFLELRLLARRSVDTALRDLYQTHRVAEQSAAALVNTLARTSRQHVFAVLRIHDGVVVGADNAIVLVGGDDAWRVTVAFDDASMLVCEAIERSVVVEGLMQTVETL